jgi:formate dehydrogenase beta subunit
MPADYAEIHDAEEEKVNFHFLTAPVRILAEDERVVGLECLKMALGETDESGRPRPVPVEGSEFVFECDMVVAAIGQRVNLSLLEGVDEIQTTRWNTVVVNEFTKQSDRPKIFFAGDCETGPDAIITACAGGHKAAHNIDRFINNLPLEYDDSYYFDKLFKSVKVYNPKEEVKRVESRPRIKPAILPAEPRKSRFDEVEQSLTAQEAVAEAERCMRCYQVATIAI